MANAQDIIQRLRVVVDGINDVKRDFDKLAADGKKAFEDIERSGTKSVESIAQSFDRLGTRFERFGSRLQSMGQRWSLYISAPIIAGFTAAVKAATDFESAMADVEKVVDFPTPDGLAKLGEDLRAMSLELPVAAEGLASIAAAAGQAGIAAGDLTEFTELVAQVSVAFGITASEAGESLAQIKTALGLTIPEVRLLSDAMNELANNMATSEAEVLRVVTRVGSLGEVAGVTAKDIAAIGAAMVSAGVDADRASTGLQALLLAFQSGEGATKRQQDAWEQLGYTSVEVARRIQTEGAGLILEVFERINQQAPEVQASILEALGGRRVVGAFSPLLNNLDVMREGLGLVSDEAEYAGATLEEFAVRAETSGNKFQLFKNHINNLAIVIGAELLPLVVEITEKINEWLATMSEAEASTIKWGAAIAGLAAAFGPVIMGIGMLVSTIGGLLTNIGKLIMFLVRWRTTIMFVVTAFGLLSAPMALLVIGIGALAGVILTLIGRHNDAAEAAYNHSEAMREVKEARDAMDAGVEGSAEKLAQLGKAHLEAAQAAVTAAREELEALKELRAAREDAVNREGWSDFFDRGAIDTGLDEIDQQIDTAINNVKRGEERIKNLIAEIGRAPEVVERTAKEVLDAASGTSNAVEGLAQRVIRVFHGTEEAGRYAVDSFGKVTGKVDETGKALEETAGKTIGVIRGAEDVGRYAVDEFGRVTGAIKETGDAAEEAGDKTETEAEAAEQSAERQVQASKRVQEEHQRTGEAIETVKTSIVGAGEETVRTLDTIGNAGAEIAARIPETTEAVVEQVTAITETVPETLAAINESVGTATTGMVDTFQTAMGTLNSTASDTSGAIGNLFDTAAAKVVAAFVDMETSIKGIFRSIVSAAESAANSIVAAMDRATAAAKRAEAAARSAAAAGAKGYAMGGPVWGPGSSTSDSIFARLSRGEYVIRAAAVMRYGTRLFDMLNNMSMPKDLIKGFNLGGLVDNVMPAPVSVPMLANGGQVPTEGKVPLYLQMPDGSYVRTEIRENAVDQVLRHVTGKRLRTLGKRPSGR